MWSAWGQSIQKFGTKYAWTVALFATWFLYLTIVVSADLWSYLGFPHAPYFADLYAVLSAADCKNLGYDVFRTNPCDPWQRIHVYGSTWLWLGKTGLGRSDVLWLGAGIDIAFATLVVRLINPNDLWEFIAGTLVVLSPAVTFAMERCTPNIIIFLLLSCAALLVSKRKSFLYLGIITSFFAALLNIYPVITMFAAALTADSRRRLITATAIASLLIISWLLFSADELTLLRHTIGRAHAPWASGGTLLFDALGIQSHLFLLSLGLALIVLIIASRLAMELDVKATVVDAHRPLVSHYYFGLSVTSFTFLSTMPLNDYHWIFNIFCLPWLFLLKREAGNYRGIRLMVVICVALMIIWMWFASLIVASGPTVLRWLMVVKQLSALSMLTVLAAIGIKTFMIEGSYVSAMFDRFLARTLSSYFPAQN